VIAALHRTIFIAVAALSVTGCPGRGALETVRLVNGKPQPGRYVSPGAYEHYLRSQIALHKGDVRQAAEETRAALTMDPRSPFLHFQLARVLVRDNKLDEARRELKQALELKVDFPDALVLLGRLEWQLGKHAKAEAYLRRCIQRNPKHEAAYLHLAELLETLERPRDAARVLKQLLAKSSRAAAGHLRLAVLCLRQMDYPCSVRHFGLALRTRTDLSVLLQLAHVHRSRGDLKLAIRLLREAFDRSGGDHRVAATLLLVLQQKDRRQAQDDLLAILERSAEGKSSQVSEVAQLSLATKRPGRALRAVEAQLLQRDDVGLQLVRAEALAKLGRTKEAEVLLRKHLGGDQGVNAALRLARILGRRKDQAGASAVLRQALTRHGHSDDLVLALSGALFAQGKVEPSIQTVRDALQGRPESRRLRFGLGSALERAGRWKQALVQVRRVLKRHPKHAPAHNFIGYIQVEHKVELEAAERSIRRALFLQPGEGYIIDSLGWLYYRRGDLARARTLLEMAARLSPQEPEILAHVAEVNVSLKRLAKAIALLRRAIDLSEDHRITTRLRRRLQELERRRVGTRSPGDPASRR
jgi:tetratricopeptide (TPR) repeat protein